MTALLRNPQFSFELQKTFEQYWSLNPPDYIVPFSYIVSLPDGDEDRTVNFDLPFALYKHQPPGSDSECLYYEIFDLDIREEHENFTWMGAGRFCEVFKSLGRVKIDSEGTLSIEIESGKPHFCYDFSARTLEVEDPGYVIKVPRTLDDGARADGWHASLAADARNSGLIGRYVHSIIDVDSGAIDGLILEKAGSASLRDVLQNPDRYVGYVDFSFKGRVELAYKILRAVDDLYRRLGGSHADIKPENIMLFFSGSGIKVTLIDVESVLPPISPRMSTIFSEECGISGVSTSIYMAPELLSGGRSRRRPRRRISEEVRLGGRGVPRQEIPAREEVLKFYPAVAFSVAGTLAEWFGAYDFYRNREDGRSVCYCLDNLLRRDLIKGGSYEERRGIKEIVRLMSKPKVKERLGVKQAIERMEEQFPFLAPQVISSPMLHEHREWLPHWNDFVAIDGEEDDGIKDPRQILAKFVEEGILRRMSEVTKYRYRYSVNSERVAVGYKVDGDDYQFAVPIVGRLHGFYQLENYAWLVFRGKVVRDADGLIIGWKDPSLSLEELHGEQSLYMFADFKAARIWRGVAAERDFSFDKIAAFFPILEERISQQAKTEEIDAVVEEEDADVQVTREVGAEVTSLVVNLRTVGADSGEWSFVIGEDDSWEVLQDVLGRFCRRNAVDLSAALWGKLHDFWSRKIYLANIQDDIASLGEGSSGQLVAKVCSEVTFEFTPIRATADADLDAELNAVTIETSNQVRVIKSGDDQTTLAVAKHQTRYNLQLSGIEVVQHKVSELDANNYVGKYGHVKRKFLSPLQKSSSLANASGVSENSQVAAMHVVPVAWRTNLLAAIKRRRWLLWFLSPRAKISVSDALLILEDFSNDKEFADLLLKKIGFWYGNLSFNQEQLQKLARLMAINSHVYGALRNNPKLFNKVIMACDGEGMVEILRSSCVNQDSPADRKILLNLLMNRFMNGEVDLNDDQVLAVAEMAANIHAPDVHDTASDVDAVIQYSSPSILWRSPKFVRRVIRSCANKYRSLAAGVEHGDVDERRLSMTVKNLPVVDGDDELLEVYDEMRGREDLNLDVTELANRSRRSLSIGAGSSAADKARIRALEQQVSRIVSGCNPPRKVFSRRIVSDPSPRTATLQS